MVRVVADTLWGLPLSLAAERDIPVLPQYVVFGEKSYRDDTECPPAALMQRMRTSTELPHTAAPPPSLYGPVFDQLLARDPKGTILVIAPSDVLSGTVRSATAAARQYPDADIRVVDTRAIAAPLGIMVLLADDWAKQGLGADEIISRLSDLSKRLRIYFVVDTLEYLRRGGRIGGARALVGGMLQIKPILTLREGRTEPYEQQRTRHRAWARLEAIVTEQCPHTLESRLCVLQGGVEEESRAMAQEFAAKLGISDVPVYEVPATVLVHAGPGVIAACFFAAP
jgi:DegV family protein with EDD domain